MRGAKQGAPLDEDVFEILIFILGLVSMLGFLKFNPTTLKFQEMKHSPNSNFEIKNSNTLQASKLAEFIAASRYVSNLLAELAKSPEGGSKTWELVQEVLNQEFTVRWEEDAFMELTSVKAIETLVNGWDTPNMAKDLCDILAWCDPGSLDNDDDDDNTKAGEDGAKVAVPTPMDPLRPQLRDVQKPLEDKFEFLNVLFVNNVLHRCKELGQKSQAHLLRFSQIMTEWAEKTAFLHRRPSSSDA